MAMTQPDPSANLGDTPAVVGVVDTLIEETLGALNGRSNNAELEFALKLFATRAATLNPVRSVIARAAALVCLKELSIAAPAKLINRALAMATAADHGENGTGPSVTFEEVEPASQPQDGGELLNDLSEWYSRYIYFPDGEPAANAAAGWTLATWCVDHIYFAPLLILPSPTKRAGKTTLLDLLSPVVRRGHLTSAFGATGAVVFQLNDAQRPTFLIDEAERLGGRYADHDLVNLLNQGHRRGGKVDRCKQMPTGGFEVESFDAFGFRALALIGKPWDTLLDRGIVVRLERKPRGMKLARWGARKVKTEGQLLASRIARWVSDRVKAVGEAEETVPRPTWLSDRGCDNWSPIFAVAAVVGGAWPERLATAAKALQNAIEDDGDRGERAVLDIGRIFEGKKKPVVIASGELVTALNQLEESNWAEERQAKGLSTQGLAALLRPFKIRPRVARIPGSGADPIRGYWWVDVKPVVELYRSPAQTDVTPTGVTSDRVLQKTPQNPRENAGCNSVTDVTPWAGRDRGEGSAVPAQGAEDDYEVKERLAIQTEGEL